VVTADHETGGLAIVDRNGQLEARYAHGSHSAGLVPLFARGPASERFGGLKGNDEIGRLLLELVAAHSAPN
jgi:alkaline phosphatase